MGPWWMREGVRVLVALVAASFVLLASAPATAIITFDLLHDTPRTRELLKGELGAAGLANGSEDGAGKTPAARGEFESIWFARENYLQIGEVEKAEKQLDLLWERTIERGIRSLPEFGTLLVREAERGIRAGNWEQGARALSHARRLAPDELSVYTTGALLAFKRSALNVAPVWEEFSNGLNAVRRSFRLQAWLGANVYTTLLAGLVFFFCVSVGVLCIANAQRLVHDLREILGFGSPRARAILSWMLLLSPALIGLAPWWWIVLGGLVLWPYLTTAPRALIAAGAIFLLLLPTLIRESAMFVTLPQNRLLEAVVRVREGHWEEPEYRELKNRAEQGTAGVAGVTALGITSQRLGRIDEAEAAVRAGLAAVPDNSVLLNNLGNIAFQRRDLVAATESYQKAVAVDPRQFAAHYNLGVAFRDQFNFTEGEVEMRLAGEIDPGAVAYFAGLPASRLKELTVDAVPPLSDLWGLAHADDEAQEAAADLFWEASMLGPSLRSWPLVIAALLLLSVAVGAWRLRQGTSQTCERCGRVFCPLCQGGKAGFLCSQCHHIFVKKAGVDARVRVQKMGDIKNHRRLLRIRHVVLAALAPGGGHLSAGRFWPGVILLLPASFYESRIFGAGSFLSPWSLGSAASTSPLRTAGIVVFALWWLLSLWLVWRLEE